VHRTTATETARRAECIADFSSGFLSFYRVNGADFLTDENRDTASRAGEKYQFALAIAATATLIS
jgi:hypothetical protein